MWNKIVNPKTGRKVNVTSKIGKSVLRNYMNQLGGNNVLIPEIEYANEFNADISEQEMNEINDTINHFIDIGWTIDRIYNYRNIDINNNRAQYAILHRQFAGLIEYKNIQFDAGRYIRLYRQ